MAWPACAASIKVLNNKKRDILPPQEDASKLSGRVDWRWTPFVSFRETSQETHFEIASATYFRLVRIDRHILAALALSYVAPRRRTGNTLSPRRLVLVSLTLTLAAVLFLSACTEEGTGPGYIPPAICEDASVLALPRFSVTRHKSDTLVRGVVTDTIPGVKWARGDSVKAFFGGKEARLVFTLDRQMYYVVYRDGEPTVTRISQGDESRAGGEGAINSPLISPDGKWVTFAGTTLGKPAFVQGLAIGDSAVKRTPIDPKARTTADPHWHVENGKTWIYFSTLPSVVQYNAECGQIAGSTYRVERIDDTTFGEIEITGIAGAYRGGLSRDGRYAGTTYSSTAIFDREIDTTHLILPNRQQCNASMNPFPAGSRNTDLMMVLAFGGSKYPLVTGDSVTEGLHENLWIYNKHNQVVWRAKRPDPNHYVLFDKPEWSTHPQYATATALRRSDEQADLMVVKIGDLADAEIDSVREATGYLKLAEGGFNRDAYTHMWVEP
jgi:hypothetical protein